MRERNSRKVVTASISILIFRIGATASLVSTVAASQMACIDSGLGQNLVY